MERKEKKEKMRNKKTKTRNSGRCHSAVHKPYEILIMAPLAGGLQLSETLRKRDTSRGTIGSLTQVDA